MATFKSLVYILIAYLSIVTFSLVFAQIFRNKKCIKESFNTSALELRSLNSHGKMLTFPYYQDLSLNAAQRAQPDNSVTSVLPGKCALVNTNRNNQSLNNSLSIVHENNLVYVLKKSCIALRAFNPRLTNNNTTLTLTFSLDSPDDVTNLTRFILVQPLFVEFNMNTMYSVAYIPRFTNRNWNTSTPFVYQNFNTSRTLDISFDIALPKSEGWCDRSFDYSRLSSAVQLSPGDFTHLISSTDRHVHMNIYYIDPDAGSSFQSTGRTFKPVTSPNDTSVTIFDRNFSNWSRDASRLPVFEFMNNISLSYHNLRMPILTYSIIMRMDQKLTPGTRQDIVQCNMQNLSNIPISCQSFNLWGLTVVHVNNNVFELLLRTEDGNQCGSRNTDLSPPVSIRIPYVSTGTDIHVTFTITANEKRLYAEWQDLSSGNISKLFVFGTVFTPYSSLPYNVCRDERRWNRDLVPRTTNYISTIFTSRNTPRPKLDNIVITYQKPIVSSVSSVTLGHVNYLRQVNDV